MARCRPDLLQPTPRNVAIGGSDIVMSTVSALAYAVVIEIPHFVMERKMLLGIKQRAEALARGRGEH
jgi:hypothetical protein